MGQVGGRGGECPQCQTELHARPKLAISEPGDSFERAADRVAEQVMRAPEPAASAEKDRKPKLQRRAADQTEPEAAPSIVDDVLRSQGTPLDPGTREFFEPRFGHDLGAVRVHTDAKAAESARGVHALAYTVGSHIVFGADQYAPSTSTGLRLIGHELVHSIQQGENDVHLARQIDPTARQAEVAVDAITGAAPHVNSHEIILDETQIEGDPLYEINRAPGLEFEGASGTPDSYRRLIRHLELELESSRSGINQGVINESDEGELLFRYDIYRTELFRIWYLRGFQGLRETYGSDTQEALRQVYIWLIPEIRESARLWFGFALDLATVNPASAGRPSGGTTRSGARSTAARARAAADTGTSASEPTAPATRQSRATSEVTVLTNVEPEIPPARVLSRYAVGSGFSGAYDPASGQWVALASGNATLASGRPIRTVRQAGGHIAAENALIAKTGNTNVSQNVGFVLIWRGNNTVEIRWNSGTINARNFDGDAAAPSRYRQLIRTAIETVTGYRVVE